MDPMPRRTYPQCQKIPILRVVYPLGHMHVPSCRLSVSSAEIHQPSTNLARDVRRSRKYHAEVSRGVETHSGKHKDRFFSVKSSAEFNVVYSIYCRVDLDQHVQRASRRRA